MKNTCLLSILVFSLGCHSTTSVNMANHPLNHPQFVIIDCPRSSWNHGWMYHTEVMAYLFKTEPERQLAISRLAGAGYGAGKTDYLYMDGNNISVNGVVFADLARAKEYIQTKKMRRVLYTGAGGIFPNTIPASVKIDGVDFWMIDWRK